MLKEFSAGGIVLQYAQDKFQNDIWEVLLIKSSGTGFWQFPKGHIEKGQTTQEAALREVREEGGVEAEVLAKVGQSKYVYLTKAKEKVTKVVMIFLMKYLSGDPKDHDSEVSEAKWVESTEALKLLTFTQDRALLKKALMMINEGD